MRNADVLDGATPSTSNSILQKLKLGKLLRQCIKQRINKALPVAAASLVRPQVSTLSALELPDEAKAGRILRAYARVATAGAGELVEQTPNTTPATTQVAIAPNGDIVFLTVDAITSVDVEYVPAGPYEVVTLTNVPVAADSLALPAGLTARGVIYLIACTVVTGTVTGKKTVLAPNSTAPATLFTKLNFAKTAVAFAAADAVSVATVTLAVAYAATENAAELLEADAVTF